MSAQGRSQTRGAPTRWDTVGAFTLVELLVVVALVGALVAVVVSGFDRGGGMAREAAASLLASRVAEARGLATSRGQPVRLLVHADPAQPERYLRFVVLAVSADGGWRLADGGSFLPAHTAILPSIGPAAVGPGLIAKPGEDWSRPSGGLLRSTALVDQSAEAETPELLGTRRWLRVHFAPGGGVFAGDLIVASSRISSAGAPVTLICEQPDAVTGVSLSVYGVATFARGRAEF